MKGERIPALCPRFPPVLQPPVRGSRRAGARSARSEFLGSTAPCRALRALRPRQGRGAHGSSGRPVHRRSAGKDFCLTPHLGPLCLFKAIAPRPITACFCKKSLSSLQRRSSAFKMESRKGQRFIPSVLLAHCLIPFTTISPLDT